MSKKILNNRIQSLFDDLNREVPQQPASPDWAPTGWAWECDSQGRYTNCGREVASILGFTSEEFGGQDLAGFALEESSKIALQKALLLGKYPITIDLNYHSTNQHIVAVTAEILPIPWNDQDNTTDANQDKPGAFLGWRGFTRVKPGPKQQKSSQTAKQRDSTQESSSSSVLQNIPGETAHQPSNQQSPLSQPEPPIAAPSWPTYKPGPSSGYRAEGFKVQPVSTSTAPAGLDSLPKMGPLAQHNQPDEPATLALSTLFEEGNSNLLLEFLDEDPYRSWSENERLLVEQVADQLSLALENARLFEQTQMALAETAVLYQASAELSAAQDYSQILATLQTHTIAGSADKLLTLVLFNRPWLKNDIPESNQIIARWTSLPAESLVDEYPLRLFPSAGQLLSATTATVIEDVPNDPRLDDAIRFLYMDKFRAASTIFVPLVVAGQWIGLINGVYGVQTRFEEAEIRRMMTLVGQAAVAIQNLRLLEETRLRNEELAAINSVIAAASRSLELNEMLQQVLTQALETVKFEMGFISLTDPGSQKLYLAVHKNLPEALLQQLSKAGLDGTLCELVYRSGQALSLEDIADSAPIDVSGLLKLGLRSYLGAPLISKGQALGTLCVFGRQPEYKAYEMISLVQAIGQQVGAAIENARAYELSQKAVAEMREVDRLKSQFLANMSHELRTPLNSIIGFSRVILKGIDGPINEVQEQDLRAIYNSGQHLLNLINDVLDLSKIEAGKLELAFEDQVNLNDLIQSVMSTVIGLVKDKPIKLLKDLAPDLPRVRADPTKIRQILINLYSNAAKFTERGAITITADQQIDPKGRPEVMITVTDTGPGITPEDQAKLFQPFSQVDASLTRKTGGTGLGLSICRHLVEMHNGRIGLLSEVGKGSSFYFTLPVSAPDPEPWETGGARVVLAIDDERSLIQLYERYLMPHGYRVLALSDPADAVKRAEEVEPYAILLDVMMPVRDGWQVLKDLKANPATAAIPVIMCSLLENQIRWQELGANAYITKPVLEEDLVHALESIHTDAQKPSVLMIADDQANLEKVAGLLDEQAPFQVRHAIGGTEALLALDSKLPDVILLATEFDRAEEPGPVQAKIDCFTLLETLNADPRRRAIPIIILTETDPDPELRSQLNRYSPEMLLKAPIQAAELHACIDHCLQLKAYPYTLPS